MNKKDVTIQKINQFGKVGNIIATILKVFIIIGLVGCIIGAVALTVLPKDLFTMNLRGDATVNVDLSAFGVKFNEKQQKEIMESLTQGEQSEVVGIDGSINVDGVELEEITNVSVNENSFSFNAAGDMATITFGRLVFVVVAAIIHLIMTLVTLHFVGNLCKAFRDCETPFAEDVIKKMQNLAISLIPWAIIGGISEGIINAAVGSAIDINIGVNFPTIFAILIILALVYVFKYGAKLQQEADETL